MKRIGIIGTENSHALAFTELINGGMGAQDARVVAVYGPDQESAEKVAQVQGVEFIAQHPQDFVGKVDAMMITCRKGSAHIPYALPFLQAGLPLFIDKPFTADPAQADDFIAQAQELNVPIMGGSGCKYLAPVVAMRQRVAQLRETGELISVSVNFPADTQSEHDGLYFYAPHLSEILLDVLGNDLRSVIAHEKKGLTALFRYDDIDAAALFTLGASQYTGVIYSTQGNEVFPIGLDGLHENETGHFLGMLKTGIMPRPYEDLARPVHVIAALIKALQSGKDVPVT